MGINKELNKIKNSIYKGEAQNTQLVYTFNADIMPIMDIDIAEYIGYHLTVMFGQDVTSVVTVNHTSKWVNSECVYDDEVTIVVVYSKESWKFI